MGLFKQTFFIGSALILILQAFPAPAADVDEDMKRLNTIKLRTNLPLLTCIEKTLAQQPNILIQREQTYFDEGSYQFQKGAFDTFLKPAVSRQRENTPQDSVTALTVGAEKQTAKILDSSLTLEKKFRNGISVAPKAQISQNNTTNDLIPTTNRAKVDFVITVPLLRDFGEEATGAQEMAAEKNLQASLSTLKFVTSQSIFNTISAYWNYVGAKNSLEIFKETEEQARILVEKTQILVDAGERPRADMDQLKANLADKSSSRYGAEQTLLEAKQALGIAMGVDFESIDNLSLPSNPFPELAAIPYPRLHEKDPLILKSHANRGDLEAQKYKEKGAEILMVSAKNGLLHKFDINFSAGYSGLDEGPGANSYFDSVEENVSGFNSFVSGTYEWPFANDTQRGLYLQAKSTYRQNVIQTYDLRRNISSRVAVAISDLRNSSEQYENSVAAYQYYENAMKSEIEKLKLGMSTFLDVIQFQDKLLSTKLNHISAHQRYAIALAKLRFETGTLLRKEVDGTYSVALNDVLSIPLRD